MKKIDIVEMKGIMLDILKDIHKYTTEHGMRYRLVSGTLLGAIRHNGYIPWDDDIDIWMPRPDYDRFLVEYSHPSYKVICSLNDKDYPLDYAKVQDIRTVMHEEGGDGNWGISIDVFPLDGFPTVEEGKRMFEKTRKFRRFAANQRFTRKGKIEKSNGIAKNIAVIAGRMMHHFISLNSILLRLDKMMKKYDFDSMEYCGCLCWRELIFTNKMVEPSTHIFEDQEFVIPKDYDSVLRIIFGDYMKLPPIEEQNPRHNVEAYWK